MVEVPLPLDCPECAQTHEAVTDCTRESITKPLDQFTCSACGKDLFTFDRSMGEIYTPPYGQTER